MTDPDGQKRVYLVKSDVPVSASVGTQLEDGYVVENISEEGIILYQAAQDTRAVITVPSTPTETVTQ
jgi:hypothetical protein